METGFRLRKSFTFAVLLLASATVGCSQIRNTVPASSVSPGYFASTRSTLEPIDYTRLRRPPSKIYLLGPGDILGIYIEGVLGKVDEAPPVRYAEQRDSQPSLGYPVPVREDGTLALPLVPPIKVSGMTIAQAEREIRIAYTVTQKILAPGRHRIMLSLMEPRTYQVLVIREDTILLTSSQIYRESGTRESVNEPARRGLTKAVKLRAYENDVLHALSESGGLPGLDAKNEIKILRGAFRDGLTTKELQDPIARAAALNDVTKVVRIPLRVGPKDPPLKVAPDDVILQNGDVVFIESRQSEVFYTGGLLRGGQFPLPRDYDIDVLGAIALSGGSIAAAAGGSATASGTYRNGSIFPPTRVIVLRTLNGRQIAIELSLKKAMTDPHERILVQPNDIVLLEYTQQELVSNVVLNMVTFSVALDNLTK